MPLKIAIQMDPPERLDLKGDSTFALALEASARGHSLFFYEPDALCLEGQRLTARGRDMAVFADGDERFELGEAQSHDLLGLDVVLMRQDPPFDMGYITATHLLDHIHPRTLVVNDPAHVRNAPEKLFVTEFSRFMPPTMITRDRACLARFRAEHGDVIVKPLYGNGGAGVFRIAGHDENFTSLLELFETMAREPFIIQQYRPEVRDGDKRIILVDGEVAGAINRVPAAGEARSNMHVGGRPERTGLTAREEEICAALGPVLRERGLIFVGIDVIGDYLTEINVTSPTGIREVRRFGGSDIAALVWDAIERRLAGER
jgi:glutathione synthase